MHKVELSYSLGGRRSPDALIRNPLMDLLTAVRENGSISGAARAMSFSYRHVWGELKRWEQELGHPLIIWDKGQPARLTEFGDKLLWAERQAQARLAPQVQALHADLERAFALAFDDSTHVLSFHASHDDALVQLREHAAASANLHLDIHFAGSVDAISALNEGRCVMAGFHVREAPAPGSLAERVYKPLLQPGLHKIIGFAQRSQGLMVARGNPLGIDSLAALRRTQARYVNRPLGTGTRVLFDELLAQDSLVAADIAGYQHMESSHSAVAQAIAGGTADAGLGIETAARTRNLGFVPLVLENYYLVCLKSALEQPATVALLKVLSSEPWQAHLRTLAGYTPSRSGEILAMHKVLPWWNFRRKKAAAS